MGYGGWCIDHRECLGLWLLLYRDVFAITTGTTSFIATELRVWGVEKGRPITGCCQMTDGLTLSHSLTMLSYISCSLS